MRQLIDDAEIVIKEAGTNATCGNLTMGQISDLASSLSSQLEQLHLEEVFGPDLDVTDLCVNDALLRRCVTSFNKTCETKIGWLRLFVFC